MDGHEDQEENHTMADEKSCDGMEQGRKRSWGRAPSGHTLSSCLSLDIGRLLTQQTLPPHPGQPPPRLCPGTHFPVFNLLLLPQRLRDTQSLRFSDSPVSMHSGGFYFRL